MTWRHYGDYKREMKARGIEVSDLPRCQECQTELFLIEEHRLLQEALGPDLAQEVIPPVILPNHTCGRDREGLAILSLRLN